MMMHFTQWGLPGILVSNRPAKHKKTQNQQLAPGLQLHPAQVREKRKKKKTSEMEYPIGFSFAQTNKSSIRV